MLKIEESTGIEEKYHQEASVVLFGKKIWYKIVKCQVKIELKLRKKDGQNRLMCCRFVESPVCRAKGKNNKGSVRTRV